MPVFPRRRPERAERPPIRPSGSAVRARRKSLGRGVLGAAFVLAITMAAAPTGHADSSPPTATLEELSELSLEDLLDLEVISASKKSEPFSGTATAMTVVTREDIQRSGATSIPEALRGVPGLQVYQLDVDSWAITARGFNGLFADKLLVLIDGRSVFNTLFGSVFWDTHDTLIEDVERIEVIRGPGGTLWGRTR